MAKTQKMIFQAENELDKYKLVIAKRKALYERHHLTNTKTWQDIMEVYNALPLADRLDVDQRVDEMVGAMQEYDARREYLNRCAEKEKNDWFNKEYDNVLLNAINIFVKFILIMAVLLAPTLGIMWLCFWALDSL